MKDQTLIVSSLIRPVTVKCERVTDRISVAIDIGNAPCVQFNWHLFTGVASRARLQRYWLNQGTQLGRLALELEGHCLSAEDIERVVTFVGDTIGVWASELMVECQTLDHWLATRPDLASFLKGE